MKRYVKYCFFRLFPGLIFLVIYCEFLIFYFVQMKCDWPSLDPTHADKNITSTEQPLKVMVIADTHLLGSKGGHWFDKLRREWQMYRAFQTAVTIHGPELVFVLGDLLDEGQICGEAEFDYYIKRFYDLFQVPDKTQMFVVAGNHDMGFHYRINPYLQQRFQKAFDSPAVRVVSAKGNHFVLVNSMALEGDGCFLCKPAEEALMKVAKQFQCSRNHLSHCDSIEKLTQYSRPILLQHYPLYRESDKDCADFDAASAEDKEVGFREKWDCLSKEATYQILSQIRPRLALSGHTHHGCTRPLPMGNGIEITIPSFSWRNKDNPNYALGLFTANNYAIKKCEMPKESTVIRLYIWGFVGLVIWIIVSRRARSR